MLSTDKMKRVPGTNVEFGDILENRLTELLYYTATGYV